MSKEKENLIEQHPDLRKIDEILADKEFNPEKFLDNLKFFDDLYEKVESDELLRADLCNRVKDIWKFSSMLTEEDQIKAYKERRVLNKMGDSVKKSQTDDEYKSALKALESSKEKSGSSYINSFITVFSWKNNWKFEHVSLDDLETINIEDLDIARSVIAELINEYTGTFINEITEHCREDYPYLNKMTMMTEAHREVGMSALGKIFDALVVEKRYDPIELQS